LVVPGSFGWFFVLRSFGCLVTLLPLLVVDSFRFVRSFVCYVRLRSAFYRLFTVYYHIGLRFFGFVPWFVVYVYVLRVYLLRSGLGSFSGCCLFYVPCLPFSRLCLPTFLLRWFARSVFGLRLVRYLHLYTRSSLVTFGSFGSLVTVCYGFRFRSGYVYGFVLLCFSLVRFGSLRLGSGLRFTFRSSRVCCRGWLLVYGSAFVTFVWFVLWFTFFTFGCSSAYCGSAV